MKHIHAAVQALSFLALLAGCAALFVLELRWIAPSEAQWAQIDAMYVAAEKRHEFICVYANESPVEWLRGTHFNIWLHTPKTLHAAVAVLIVGGLTFLCAGLTFLRAAWFAGRIEARMREEEV
jgi:hypothetical protein